MRRLERRAADCDLVEDVVCSILALQNRLLTRARWDGEVRGVMALWARVTSRAGARTERRRASFIDARVRADRSCY